MSSMSVALMPLSLHRDLHRHVAAHEPALWAWFASQLSQQAEDEAARLELLKSSYQLTPQSHASVVEAATAVAQALSLDVPVKLYQLYGGEGPNAMVRLLAGEAQILFSGPILDLLDDIELKAVLAHELAHVKLWAEDGGVYHVLHRLLMRVAAEDPYSETWESSASHYARATELYADLGSLTLCGDLRPVVSGLVKTLTGLKCVDADGYLRQTAEIFAKGEVAPSGFSHPEIYIRTRALQLAAEGAADWQAAVEKLIVGPLLPDRLNLLDRHRLAGATLALLKRVFAYHFLRSERLLSHAQRYFAHYDPDAALPADAPDPVIYFATVGSELQDYAAAVLLDFAAADPGLEDVAAAAAWTVADALGVGKSFESRLGKDLKYKKAAVQKLRGEAAAVVVRANGGAP